MPSRIPARGIRMSEVPSTPARTPDEGDADIPEDAGWFALAREELYRQWTDRTGHGPGCGPGSWACQVGTGCRSCGRHLSVPCSLNEEANEIGLLLSVSCFDEKPETFLRLYLVLLSEFSAQLESVADLLGIQIGKPPPLVKVWANRWAKHKLHIVVQHHPEHLFSDTYRSCWMKVEPKIREIEAIDQCGQMQPCRIVDTAWLENAKSSTPDLGLANSTAPVLILVPPLMTF